MAIALVSVAIQLASVAFWHPLEIHQMETLGHPTFVVGLRFKNIAAVTLGKADEWGLSNEDTREVGGIHSNTLYFLPFLLKKTQRLPDNRRRDDCRLAGCAGHFNCRVVIYSAQGAKRRLCRSLASLCCGGRCGVALDSRALPPAFIKAAAVQAAVGSNIGIGASCR